MDRFLAYTVFAKVVEHGSFAGAAARLALSTSAVSRHVADLEAHLGTRLINRTTRRLSLTESGQAFFERCVQLLAEVEEAEQTATKSGALPQGVLRITSSINFGLRHLASALAAFRESYPDVRFDISLSDRFVDLVEEGFDLGIRVGESGAQSLITRKIGQSRLITCAAPRFLKTYGTPQHPADLAKFDCLTYEYRGAKNVYSFRDAKGDEIKVRVAGTLHANHGEFLAAVAALGGGIVIEPDFIVEPHLETGALVRILDNFAPPPATIYAVYPSRRHLSAKVRLFVDFLAERLRR